MIIGNLIGFLMFVIAGIVVAISHFLLKLSDPLTMGLAGLALFVLDFAFRLVRKQDSRWFYANNQGGNLFFLPAWGIGAIVIIANIVRLGIGK
jgi:uncharacterized membrane protein